MGDVALKVLHVAALNFPSNQGTQVYIRQLCESQGARGHDVHLLTYARGLPGYEPKRYTLHRLGDFPRFTSLRSGPSLAKVALDCRMAAAVGRLVRSLKPHIVHGHHYEGLAASLAAAAGRCPVVYHGHTLMAAELPWYFNHEVLRRTAARAGRWADRILPRRADAAVTVSPYLRSALRSMGIADRRLLYLPPALDAFDGEEEGGGQGRAEGADMVYAGNLDRYQGLFQVLEGLALITRGPGREAMLLVVTDSDFSRHREYAERLGLGGRVIFVPHGRFGTAASRISASTLAVSPRLIPGGFPIKLLNYLRYEKPVLATRHGSGGLAEGDEILLYDSPARFAEAAAALLSNPGLQKRLGRAGHRRLKDEFSWRRSLPLLDDLYESLLPL
jgi:glycosyltransferase involved in cell wall biosynthesis